MGDVLDYDEVLSRLDTMMDWLAGTYMDALNIIHYMHDKYCYERLEMALHDRDILRTMACGIAGLSIGADSLSAIKYAKVHPIRDARGLITDFEIEGEFPVTATTTTAWIDRRRFGRALHGEAAHQEELSRRRGHAVGPDDHVKRRLRKKTGATPDGRKAGEPFAPGANPLHGRDKKGALASLTSVRSCPIAPRRTAYPTRSPSCPARSARPGMAAWIIWWACWTAISRRRGIT